jgi:hypothetical protein
MAGHPKWPATVSGQSHGGCALTGPARPVHPGLLYLALKCRQRQRLQEHTGLNRHSRHSPCLSSAKPVPRHSHLQRLGPSASRRPSARGEGAEGLLDNADVAKESSRTAQVEFETDERSTVDFADERSSAAGNGYASERREPGDRDAPSLPGLQGGAKTSGEGRTGTAHGAAPAGSGVQGGQGPGAQGSLFTDGEPESNGVDHVALDEVEDEQESLTDSEDLAGLGIEPETPAIATPSFTRTKVFLCSSGSSCWQS